MKWTILNKHNDMIVRDYLQEIHGFSRRLIKSVKFDGGDILVNGTGKTVRYALKTGDLLEVKFPPEVVANHMKPEKVDLPIIYEDDAIIVIDKPPQMATIPSLNHTAGTLANGLLGYYEKNDIPFTVHIVTRLDRDTSGLVLIAKHRYSHSLLSAMQKTGGLKRKYKAVIEGKLSKREGTIDAPIGRKAGSIIERTVIDTGKQAITNYKVIDERMNHSLIEIELETGRTHQIRVHFSYIGHPLAGDDLYGGSTDIITRQALHCYEISFEHPLTKKHLLFTSELPEDMEQLVSGFH
ncbi:RNA pseudouridine synthase [Virgibacillus profundi]|uniref:Pseudouridine synthase n=1 Tax=Virgibacillus profundi TaxID=2024555 RepID=A0A2A2IC28_9BACI|nr:RluA family pseudouridine synthase [Virgibacillus profundi]PAV29177.1 RNA pseudouridine synthase [Virgibacillus profundi]PXY53346.1 RluA family pseudouridine synthase [Virgibacillus profundi]